MQSFLFIIEWVPVIVAPLHGAWLSQKPRFVIRIMFFKHRLSQLCGPKIFFQTILIWLYWSRVSWQ